MKAIVALLSCIVFVLAHGTATLAQNRPVVKSGIPDLTLTVGGVGFTVDLNTVFEDADGDSLGYSAASSDTNVANATIAVDDTTLAVGLSVNPPPGGEAAIVVSADDGKDGVAVDTFSVTVNYPPRVTTPIPDDTLTVDGAPLVLELSAFFSDPDAGDSLTYGVDGLPAEVGTATVTSSGLLTISLAAEPPVGSMPEITVTAGDGRGGSAEDRFTLSVNYPPIVENAIPDATLKVGGPTFTLKLDLKDVFDDPDPGDRNRLSYEALSFQRTIVSAAVSDGMLSVVPGDSSGTDSVAVTAYDPGGGSASDTFQVQVIVNQPAVIVIDSSQTPSVQQAGRTIPVIAAINDAEGVAGATLNYRQGGEPEFTQATMTGSVGKYVSSIPGDAVGSGGVEFYIESLDSVGFTSNSRTFSIRVQVGGDGIVRRDAQGRAVAQPGGTKGTAYRLFSVPLDLNDKSPAAVLEDDLGSYNDRSWRFSELREDYVDLPSGSPIYTEYPNTSEFVPGKAFWLLVRDGGRYVHSGPGLSNRTDRVFEIPLHPGWNFVGNPFDFAVSVDKLHVGLKSGETFLMRSFTGSWDTTQVRVMLPFEGYALFKDSNSLDTLVVNPSTATVSDVRASAGTTRSDEKLLWSIRVLAQCQGSRDVDNLAAVTPAASPALDPLDEAEPPPVGQYVSVYFPHPEWGRPSQAFSRDVRPARSDGDVWQLEVRTNIHDEVRLIFEGLEGVPDELGVWLLDEGPGVARDLRRLKEYSLAGPTDDRPKRLKLLVGASNFLEHHLQAVLSVPTTFELWQNFPNPFNPATTIRYGLPQEARVTLRVYNLLGEEVTVLVDNEMKAAGRHLVIWDGRNSAGGRVAGGLYVIAMRAKDYVQTRKMILLY